MLVAMIHTRRFRPIRARILGGLLIYVVLPVIGISAFASYQTFSAVRSQLAARAQQDMSAVSGQIDIALDSVLQTYRLVLIQADQLLNRMGDIDSDSPSASVIAFAELKRAIRQYESLSGITLVRLYPDSSLRIPIDGELTFDDASVDLPALETPDQILWYLPDDLPGSRYITEDRWIALLGNIRDLSLFQVYGTAIVAIRLSPIAELMSTVAGTSRGSASLRLPDGSVLSVTGDAQIEDRTDIDMYRGAIVLEQALAQPGWRFEVIIPRSDINRRAFLALGPFLVTMVILVAAVFLLIWIWSGAFGRRISAITSELMRPQSETLPFPVRIDTPSVPRDEIDVLAQSYNHVAKEARRLVKEVYEKEAERTLAQLDALQAHVGPHLIVNALDAIRSCAASGDNVTASELIDLVARFVRRVVTRSVRTTISNEIGIATDFVAIASRLYGKDVTVESRVPAHIAEKSVLRLILQPVVENAIEHGFQNRPTGLIVIEAIEDSDGLRLVVADNGAGMLDDRVSQVTDGFLEDRPASGRSYGLWNVDRRLKVEYGEDAGLTLETERAIGTRVTLRLGSGDEHA
jgi:two-component system sensor histidine kinase YesM